MKYQLDTKDMTLDGKPISSTDMVLLMSKFAIKNDDKKMDSLVDYSIYLYECGHNGFHLKSDYQFTTNKDECVQCNTLSNIGKVEDKS